MFVFPFVSKFDSMGPWLFGKCWRRNQPCRRNPGNRRQCGRSFPLFAPEFRKSRTELLPSLPMTLPLVRSLSKFRQESHTYLSTTELTLNKVLLEYLFKVHSWIGTCSYTLSIFYKQPGFWATSHKLEWLLILVA